MNKISIWRIITYFIIYSVFGYVIETLFGIITMGVWESRQSFLYGPFCGIYGIGATVMIVGLQNVPKTNGWIFLGGFILGSITEYIISFISEKVAGVTWWDYSDFIFNINGRICLLYSIFWGALAVFLIKCINPKVDECINWIKNKVPISLLKAVIFSIFLFIVIEFIATAFAIQAFLLRMEKNYNLNIPNKEDAMQLYDRIYNNDDLSNFIYRNWGDEKMIKTFPNLKIEDADGKYIYMGELLPNIKKYYIKFRD